MIREGKLLMERSSLETSRSVTHLTLQSCPVASRTTRGFYPGGTTLLKGTPVDVPRKKVLPLVRESVNRHRYCEGKAVIVGPDSGRWN